jgi:hypothetical protein
MALQEIFPVKQARRTIWHWALLATAAPWFGSASAGDAAAPIVVEGTRVFPESITSDTEGDVIFGSISTGSIYRARAGESIARIWIDANSSGMKSGLGVLADDRSHVLYAGSILGDAAPRDAAKFSALRVFDLSTGKPKAAYPMPDAATSLCNDIAVTDDGTAYVTDTRSGRILRLKKGADALEIWIADPQLQGADGIALGSDHAIYVNTFTTGRLFRVPVAKDGRPGAIEELTPSLKLDHPDGLRSIGGLRFLQAEGVGRITEVSITGNQAHLTVLKDGVPGLTAVTVARGKIWVLNAKLAYRNQPELKDKDPGTFSAEAIDIPAR